MEYVSSATSIAILATSFSVQLVKLATIPVGKTACPVAPIVPNAPLQLLVQHATLDSTSWEEHARVLVQPRTRELLLIRRDQCIDARQGVLPVQ
jgi:hypothetical protein